MKKLIFLNLLFLSLMGYAKEPPLEETDIYKRMQARSDDAQKDVYVNQAKTRLMELTQRIKSIKGTNTTTPATDLNLDAKRMKIEEDIGSLEQREGNQWRSAKPAIEKQINELQNSIAVKEKGLTP